ncbi:MAG TPA: methyltransferase domain-containing protein [Polyangiaceae bacterium]
MRPPESLTAAERAMGLLEAQAARRRVGFAERTAMLDALEVLPAEGPPLVARADRLRSRLEKADTELVRTLRARVRTRDYTPAGLRRALLAHAGEPGRAGAYDALDRLVAAMLDGGAPAAQSVTLEPGMVPYQPTPARVVLALLERARIGPKDVFYDLGSGLGHVVLLVALLAGARGVGVEIEPAFVEVARRSARRLGVRGVSFVEGDARASSLDGGTVYFLYTPFRGALLRQVLGSIREQSRHRPIRVCTHGPCGTSVARVPWLRRVDGGGRLDERTVTVFRPV